MPAARTCSPGARATLSTVFGVRLQGLTVPASLFPVRLALRSPYRRLFAGEMLATAALTAVSSSVAIGAVMRGASAFEVALLVALIAVPVVLISPLVRPIIERLGVYRTILWTHAAVAVGMAVVAILASTRVGGLYPAYCLDVLIGLSTALHVPAVFTSLSWFVGEDQLPAGIATVNLRTALTWAAGPLFGGFFAHVDNGSLVLAVAAGATALSLLPLRSVRSVFRSAEAALAERQRHEPGCVRGSIEQGVANADVNGLCMLTQAPATVDRRLLNLLRDPDVRFAVILYAAVYTTLGSFTILLTPWASRDLHLSAAAVGTVLSLRSTASMPGPLLSGFFVRRLGMSRALVALGVATGAAVTVLSRRSSWDAIAIASVVVYGALFYCLTSGVFTTLFTVVVGPERRPEGTALFALAKALASIVFVGLGLLARTWGPPRILEWCGLAGIGGALLLRLVTARQWTRLMASFHVRWTLAQASRPPSG